MPFTGILNQQMQCIARSDAVYRQRIRRVIGKTWWISPCPCRIITAALDISDLVCIIRIRAYERVLASPLVIDIIAARRIFGRAIQIIARYLYIRPPRHIVLAVVVFVLMLVFVLALHVLEEKQRRSIVGMIAVSVFSLTA